MEVESEDEDDHRDNRNEVHSSQPDQDTQLQDMDEVRAQEFHLWPIITDLSQLLNLTFFPFFSPQGSDDEDMKVPLPLENPMPPPLPPTPDQVIIRKDYDPKGRISFFLFYF